MREVKPGLPPFLLLHGDADRTVPLQQTLNFQAALRERGVPVTVILIPGAPHGLLTWEKFDPAYNEKLVAWLRSVVGK